MKNIWKNVANRFSSLVMLIKIEIADGNFWRKKKINQMEFKKWFYVWCLKYHLQCISKKFMIRKK